MAEFLSSDRALLIRVGGHLRDAAQVEVNGYAPHWSASEDGKAAKRRHDRLLRDERDLEALRRRLEALGTTPKTPGE